MRCGDCGFELFHPLGETAMVVASLYDDGRFPGRLIVALKPHFEHLDEVPAAIASAFLSDLQAVARELRAVTGSSRVNLAVLGNAEAHVHAHLIPRYSWAEDLPRKSPWDDPRPHYPLEDRASMVELLRSSLTSLSPTR